LQSLFTVFKPLKKIAFSLVVFSMILNVLMLTPSIYMLQVYDRVLTSQNRFTLLTITALVLVVYGVIALLEWLRSNLLVRLSAAMDLAESEKIHAAAFAPTPLAKQQSPAQVMQDFMAVRQLVTGSFVLAFLDLPWVPLYLGVLFLFEWPLGLLAVIGIILLVGIAIIIEKLSKEPLQESNKIASQAVFMLNKQHRNLDIIAALGMIPVLGKRWQAHNQKALLLQMQASDKMAQLSAVGRYIRLTLQSLVLGIGAYLVLEGTMSGGMMIAGSILLGRALAPIEQLIGSWKQFIQGIDAHQRLQPLLAANEQQQASFELPIPTGQLSADNLSLVLEGRKEPILQHINFSLQAGQILAIVGPSASGKSSLARVLLGILSPTAGEVRLDNADLRQWPRDKLGQYVGYLPQDIELFEGSIAENIARFQDVDDSQIIAAAQLAHVHEMIVRLPQGYQTVIGEGGLNLSGGQRQRIALARAVFGQPKLVILDEPNSNLDDQGDTALAQTLTDLKQQGTTVIVISHRTHLLSVVEQMLLLQDGKQLLFGAKDKVLSQLQGGAR
jgi:ATP-binding cassette subfamily C exporter for protease/lipase